jgi:pilus assembly protein CpaC
MFPLIGKKKSYDIGASTLLGIRRREASTTVELPSGGSIVIAGLVRDDIRQATSGTPGLMNVPILGSLFRSRDFQRNETELVIIATPYLVRPVERSKLARPDDNFHPENDVTGFFLGRVNKIYGRKEKQPGAYNGTIGFIYK